MIYPDARLNSQCCRAGNHRQLLKSQRSRSPELKGNAHISIVPYGVSNLLSAIASLLSIILLSRLLSAEAYGYYATILALTLLCQTAGFNWI